MRRIALAAASICVLSACSDAPSSVSASAPAALQLTPSAPLMARGSTPIPGQYIVRYKPTTLNWQLKVQALASSHGAAIGQLYSTALHGAVVQMSAAAAQALSADPTVLSVEQDQVITLAATQTNATWGLDRLDQRARPLNQSYTYGPNGAGVTVYIIDTGINFGQTDFQGRAITGVDVITANGTAADCNGHGTHVAGTVGSATYGVAKATQLVAVRVLDCNGSGSTSGVLAGIDWVTRNAPRPAVVNMSLGGGYSPTLNSAVENAIAAGITYAVAAGNNAADACTVSPASAPSAITVGATDSNDAFQSWSNFGTCVRINAPGAGITSLWLGTGVNTISGTSMASPHVAGAAALYLQQNPTATPAQVRAALTTNATPGSIPSIPTGTPNLLLYTGFMNATPPATPPVASFTSSCTFLSCTFDASASTGLPTATYTWAFGDGTSGSGTTTSHSYTAGTYTVTLTVADGNGTNTRTNTVTPVANSAPTAGITAPTANASFTRNVNGTVTVAFTGSGNDPETGALSGASLVWSSSRDGQIGTGATFTKSDLTVGTHAITLTARDAQGLTGTATTSITIVAANQAPTASISSPASNGSFTQGNSVTFTGAGTDPEAGALSGASLVWTSSRDGQIGTGASFAKTNLSVGTHTITITASDAQGLTGTATTSITIVAVNQAPSVSITSPASNGSFTQGSSVTFTGAGTDPETGAMSGASLVWTSSRDGQIGTGTSFAKTNLSVGTHTITLTATDPQGAATSTTRSITITAPVPPAFAAAFTWVCGPSVSATPHTCSFDASASTGAVTRWVWTVGSAKPWTRVVPTMLYTASAAGTYTVTLTIFDAAGTSATKTQTVVIP